MTTSMMVLGTEVIQDSFVKGPHYKGYLCVAVGWSLGRVIAFGAFQGLLYNNIMLRRLMRLELCMAFGDITNIREAEKIDKYHITSSDLLSITWFLQCPFLRLMILLKVDLQPWEWLTVSECLFFTSPLRI